MARPGSMVSEIVKNHQTIAQGLPIPYEPGDLDPRLRPEDLPKYEGDKAYSMQNQTALGRAYEALEPKFSPDISRYVGKMLFKNEMLKRKGVDVDSDSLYPDGATKKSLERDYRGGKLMNPGFIEKLNRALNTGNDTGIVETLERGRARIL